MTPVHALGSKWIFLPYEEMAEGGWMSHCMRQYQQKYLLGRAGVAIDRPGWSWYEGGCGGIHSKTSWGYVFPREWTHWRHLGRRQPDSGKCMSDASWIWSWRPLTSCDWFCNYYAGWLGHAHNNLSRSMPFAYKDRRMRSAVQQNTTTEHPLPLSVGTNGCSSFFQKIQRSCVCKTEHAWLVGGGIYEARQEEMSSAQVQGSHSPRKHCYGFASAKFTSPSCGGMLGR